MILTPFVQIVLRTLLLWHGSITDGVLNEELGATDDVKYPAGDLGVRGNRHRDDQKDAVKHQDEQKTNGNRSYYEICGGARTAPEGPTKLHVGVYEAASANVIANLKVE